MTARLISTVHDGQGDERRMTSPPKIEATPVAPAGAPAHGFSERYLWAALAILFLINLANYMDRFIMSILIEPVRKEFGLSDTQAGLLTGLAFSFIYALLILPVARLSDRFSRKKILVAAVAAWSLLTTLCGAASSYATLLLARAATRSPRTIFRRAAAPWP
jgi:predicted MFS family arabinose efflux permease